ncbi:hypothetical protein HTSR_1756 [Halodesulfurarchaeum formicicum]|uniref:Uncharacterized protein n=1 Tax=Halodesulfurarchaeum formicicum TaxID=1873524 RepID=A0A1D8S6E7_9EURY|nr:hypothetical protein [Halodesulfurarchaeum formicicum]AOW80925.1 hypothetical protein HTSR_1756 [Halodesulfurarchaeum formicicum]APE96258.1 hypothetical protein HSR6_1822 [Halodesulfurarchaeum formicicum]
MVVQSELREAMESGREETIELLARNETVPVIDEEAEVSDLLGGRKQPSFKLEEADGVETVDRQTRQDVLNFLDIEDEADLEPVQEEIKNHEDWGADV